MLGNWSEDWSQFNGLINKDDVVVRHVRLHSNAGWYLGTLEFYNLEECDFYSRDSGYYPSEGMLKDEFQHSISVEEAFNKVKYDTLLRRKIDRKLGIKN